MHSLPLRASCHSLNSIGDQRRRPSAALADLSTSASSGGLLVGTTHITSSALPDTAAPSELQEVADAMKQRQVMDGPGGDDSASYVHPVATRPGGNDSLLAEGVREAAAGKPRAAIITSPHACRVMQRKIMVGVRCPDAAIAEELHASEGEAIQRHPAGGKTRHTLPLEGAAAFSSAATAASVHSSTAAACVARVNARMRTVYGSSSSSSSSIQRQQVHHSGDDHGKLQVGQATHVNRPSREELGKDATDNEQSGLASPSVAARVMVISTVPDEEEQQQQDPDIALGDLHKDEA